MLTQWKNLTKDIIQFSMELSQIKNKIELLEQEAQNIHHYIELNFFDNIKEEQKELIELELKITELLKEKEKITKSINNNVTTIKGLINES